MSSPPSPAPVADEDADLALDIPVGSNPDDLIEESVDDFDQLDQMDHEESEGEDLLDEDILLDDYKAIDELDHYDERHLDDEDYDPIDADARDAAERAMRQRDAENARAQGRLPAVLDEADDDMSEQEPKRRRIADIDETDAVAAVDEALNLDESAERVDLDAHTGPAALFLALEPTRREIRIRLFGFFKTFQEDPAHPKKVSYYDRRISEMARENRSSLIISFNHLGSSLSPQFVRWLGDEPELMLEILDEAAYQYTVSRHPKYAEICQSVHVRISRVPVRDEIRDLREKHLNALIKVEGVVTRRTSVFPQLDRVTLTCPRCQSSVGPFVASSGEDLPKAVCIECQYSGSMPVNVSETIWRNYQRITLQEPPASVPAGRVPRSKDVILLHDLIDTITPGEQIEVTGVYKHTYDRALNQQAGFPVFSTIILANHIASHREMADAELTEDDRRAIIELSKEPDINGRIIASIGPSVYGHTSIKTALALAMFGGSSKEFENGHRIRGDLNVLLLGDPGTAKSQFLKYVEKISPRGVYTTGKGASAVGLTASVHRDPVSREWTLEGGALVLADQGVCCIDEFDKMNDSDRTSIHEAMEQQSISISKAGIITTLKARCSVIAAANPLTGRYNSALPFSDNVELTDAILSRFDILCVVRDTVDREVDAHLASFVVDSHYRAHPASQLECSQLSAQYEQECADADANRQPRPEMSEELAMLLGSESIGATNYEPIPQTLLRKYIRYAKSHCKPSLDRVDDDKIARLYASLRRESFVSGGLPISVRHIESLIRMSEAHARMHLRNQVSSIDIDAAIRVMLESFISTQKFSIMRSLRKAFAPYLTQGSDVYQLINFAIQGCVNEAIQVRVAMRNEDEPLASELMGDELDAINEPISLSLDTVLDKLKDMNLTETQLHQFLQSEQAKEAKLSFNAKSKAIVKKFK